MKPAPFDYLRPREAGEALACLARHGEEARVLAGGLSLVAMLNFRLVAPRVLVDVSRLRELAYVRADGDWVEIGAATTQAELMAWPDLATALPLLHEAMPHVGHFQTRSRGTVGGSIAHAEPSSELPLCLATLGGRVVLRSERGERTLEAGEFQVGMLATARRPDELLCSVRFPVAGSGHRHAFDEVAQRRGDFAIVALAAVAHPGGVRLGIGGVADRPSVHELGDVDGEALDDRLNALAWTLKGDGDIHASARYRRHLIRRLGRAVIDEARS